MTAVVCEAVSPARSSTTSSSLFDDTTHRHSSLLGSGIMAFNSLFDSTIDYSFAMWPPPCGKRKSCHRRRRRIPPPPLPPSCLRGAAYYHPCYYDVDPCNDGFSIAYSSSVDSSASSSPSSSPSSSSSSSYRSVTFAEDVVTEVRSVPRYERESVPSLFYNRFDLQRFRHEAKLEKMRVQVIW